MVYFGKDERRISDEEMKNREFMMVRVPSEICMIVRKIAEREERTYTSVVVRAIKNFVLNKYPEFTEDKKL